MTSLTKSTKNFRNLGIGEVISWSEKNDGIKGETSSARFELTVFDEHTIRVQISQNDSFFPNPYSTVNTPKGVFSNIEENDSRQVWIKTSKIHLCVNLSPFFLTFQTPKGEIINQDDPAFAVSWLGTEVTNYKKVQKNEKFIGLGEKTGNLDRAGKAYTNWNTDYFAYGVEDDPLYMSIPFYIGIHNQLAYGIFFDNTHKSVFNFGASNNRFVYYSGEDGDMDYYFFHDDSVGKIISAYSDLTGKMEMPPLWSLGYQQCRYSYYPDSEITTLAQTFRDKDMPADVIYLDIHHMEKYKVFTFDGQKFPDPKSMIRTLKEKGFKVVVIMDPGIKTDKGYLPYDEGKEQDHFVKYPDGQIYEGQVWPGWCAFPDFTKPETRQWWAEKMAFYNEAGVDGYWTDMNEPASWGQFTPNLIDFNYEGEMVSHRKARNIYGFQMARSAMEGSLLQRPQERPFVLTRSGFSGIQRYAAAWTGDNVANEDHMMAGIRLVNSLGISGVAFAGYDVGGFAGEATKSLFARWMSIAVFSPLFRAHSMINSSDAEPWAFGEEVEEISRNYMKLRYKLLPTIYSSFYQSTKTGLPLSKSLAIDYPHDNKIYLTEFQNQYIFCDKILVAPVKSTKEITKVFLPEGDWYYMYNSQKHHGHQIIYQDCPLNYLPVYIKAGSILALQSDVSHTGEANDETLYLHIYKGNDKSVHIHYEDDGISHDYKDHGYFKREIEWDSSAERLTFKKPQGEFQSKYKKIKLYLHGNQKVGNAKIGEMTLTPKYENVAFLGKLTEFDPLPEHDHPYHEIKAAPSFVIEHSMEDFSIDFI
ncbi:glycoside hydrolase family 31 protein [Aquiflexum lacus]|uniref:glycoside hydrolase family 31 protein n=1 Tax=Aquiflexum lacus TaxID=2483805 RepID=UPI001893524F|nr:TIM-barrel domain-containing protein [Aquiflexum lacus]